MKRILFISITMSLLMACHEGEVVVPDTVIPEEKMVELLVTMHKADAEKQMNRLHYPDSTRSDTVNYTMIFTHAGVSKTLYDSSMAFYSRYPEYLDAIYDQVIERLNKEKLETETGK